VLYFVNRDFKNMRVFKSKIFFFQEKIIIWYQQNGRDFPWRKEDLNDYQKIISEILLQRTKAETINKFYPEFINKYKSWLDIKNTSTENLEEDLRPIGLYKQRANRIYSLATVMCKINGKIPRTEQELHNIPMIGQYIANAILLLIHNKRKPLIDTNMTRVLERFFGNRKLADIRYDPYLQRLAGKVVDHPMSKEINWGILDFATAICKSKNPLCLQCPINKRCVSFNKSMEDCRLPKR